MSDRDAQMTDNAVLILAKKELRLLFKSKRRIFLLTLTPIMILLIGVIAVGAVSFMDDSPASPTTVSVINDSPSNYSQTLLGYYETINNTEFTEVSQSFTELRESRGFEVLVYIPENFTSLLENSEPAQVAILYNQNSSRNQNVALQMAQLTTLYERQLITSENPDVQFNRLSVSLDQTAEEESDGLTEEIASSLFIIPVYIIFFVVIPPISLIMISVTIEREEKTLETLFLQPVPRNSIIMGKIFYGIGIVAIVLLLDIIAAIIDIILITFVIDEIGGDIGELTDALGEFVDFIGVDLILYFFLTTILISVLIVGLAVLLSLVAKDEREANLISGVLPLILFSMIFIVQIFELSNLSYGMQIGMSAIPLVGILVAFYLSLVAGNLGTIAIIGAVVQFIWTWFIIRFAARLSESESILELNVSKVLEELKNMILRR